VAFGCKRTLVGPKGQPEIFSHPKRAARDNKLGQEASTTLKPVCNQRKG